MRNPNMKVWMWQRLWKVYGGCIIYSSEYPSEDNQNLHNTDISMSAGGMYWLCPKPNLVLVNVN